MTDDLGSSWKDLQAVYTEFGPWLICRCNSRPAYHSRVITLCMLQAGPAYFLYITDLSPVQ